MIAELILAAAIQQPVPAWPGLDRATHVLVPQARGFALDGRWDPIEVEGVNAEVLLLEGVATTTLEVLVRNHSDRQAEAVILLPVPDGAAVHSFLFEGSGAEPSARLLPREEARRLYREIVNRVLDPALLEFAGHNLIQTSVFPVPPRGTQRLRLTYEHLQEIDGPRYDYLLPRSESSGSRIPWRVTVRVTARSPIAGVYSPTHSLVTEKTDPKSWIVRIAGGSVTEPGPFRLSTLLERDGVSATLFAYPDPAIGGGYFLLMAGTPATLGQARACIRREVILVIDRSGSMAGEKLDQARAAAMQVIEGLADGEAFNVVDYSTNVERFAPVPVIKSREAVLAARAYLNALRPNGGTNIHDALVEALRQPVAVPGYLPIVLFLTDGLPTVGRTAEGAISTVVEQGNPHQRRIFAFGVGADVNVPLLDRIADFTRASTSYVLPREDVEVKVAQVFERLYGPVLAGPELSVIGPDGAPRTDRIHDLAPPVLPDLFEGDPVILLGKYRDDEPLNLRLAGSFLGEQRVFGFHFNLDRATTRNAFVPRLWAGRRIAFLVDEIRQLGGGASLGAPGAGIAHDPRFRELADEILRLSTEFGVLSEYTSFLATEGTDLGQWNSLLTACSSNLEDRAWRTRSGAAAVNQGVNFNEGKLAAQLNYRNGHLDEKLARVEVNGVQQIQDRCFFKRGDEWVDGRLVQEQSSLVFDFEIHFASAEHFALIEELAASGQAGLLSLPGDIRLVHNHKTYLVRAPLAPAR
jgi:Ca-activated chloride channel family protein